VYSLFRSLSLSPTSLAKVEELMSDDKLSSDEKRASKLELKPLPSFMRYEFLGLNSTYPVIVDAASSAFQIDSLLRVLRLHCKAIGYTTDDFKGIHPFMCMHRILMEDDHKPSIEHQRG